MKPTIYVSLSFFVFSFIVLSFIIISSNGRQIVNKRKLMKTSQCGYAGCDVGKNNMLNVHLIPHSHDDVGWLKTVDQYYYGNKNNIQRYGVQYILDTTIPELYADPSKRFIYVEMAYFYRWWNELLNKNDNQLKLMTQELVQQGRLQFILGGWSMNDEATTHYVAIIDQHTRGLRFIKENFGECGRPLVAWQIDPFGHSREQANLFAQMGFDALFFWRFDHQEKDMRLYEKRMEMIWRGSDDLKRKGNLFTSLLFGDYCPPPGFCFDQVCHDDPIMDDPKLVNNYNVDQRVDEFLNYVQNQAKFYTSNHILIPMGCDFHFQNARMNYKNIDKLIKYVNARQINGSLVNLIYSTPSCYTYAVNQVNLTYTWKTDDFFPHADKDHKFWSGYFTSRAALKGFMRKSNNILQSTQQLAVSSGIEKVAGNEMKLDVLRRAMGIMQHHDASTGTHRQEISFDYAQRLSMGIGNATEIINQAFNKLFKFQNDKTFIFCPLLNISVCEPMQSLLTSNQTILLVVYNPLSQSHAPLLQLPVMCTSQWKIVDEQTQYVFPYNQIPISNRTKSIPERGGGGGGGNVKLDCQILFEMLPIPPLGYRSLLFYQQQSSNDEQDKFLSTNFLPFNNNNNNKQSDSIFIENNFLRVDFDSVNQTMTRIYNKVSTLNMAMKQSISYYYGYQGSGSTQDLSSGTYIFRPEIGSIKQNFTNVKIVAIFKNDFVEEVHQEFSDNDNNSSSSSWATQVVRLYKNSRHVEIEWTIGPIPLNDKKGREIIMNYQSDLITNGIFYTDANGRQLIKRYRDARPANENFQQSEPVAGNYYPINSRIGLESVDGSASFMVLNDRSQGGGSIVEGQVELMVHRTTINSDSLGEPLQERGIDGKGLIIRGKHYLLVERPEDMNTIHRLEALQIFHEPLLFFNQDINNNEEFPLTNAIWSGLQTELPPNVRVMTLDNWSEKSNILRLENIYQINENATICQVNLVNLFSTMNITHAVELTLAANQILNQSQRLKWQTVDDDEQDDFVDGSDEDNFNLHKMANFDLNLANITLAPMEIRTFQIFTSK